MKRMKLFFAAMLVLVSVGAAGVLAMAAEAPEGSTVVTILHTNDLHGRLVGGGNVLGLDVIAAIREATPNSILVDAGDTIHGLPFVTFFEGRNAIYLMNEAGYDLFTPGNHDFNYGIDVLLGHEYYADFGFIASNLTWAATGRSVFDRYRVVEIDGVTLGFFGLAYPGTPSVTNPAGIVGLRFSCPVEAARASVAALQDLEVDVIVALAHLGLDGSAWGPEVARAVPGIDIIIDGHSHTRLDEGYMVGDVLLAQAGGHGQFLGAVEIVMLDGEIYSISASLIDVEEAEEFGAVDYITALIEEMEAIAGEMLNVVVAYNPITLYGDSPEHRAALRSSEVPLGNLVADAMIFETGAQIALMNSGGIRAHLYEGEVTLHDLHQVHSFSNYVVVVEITPAVLFDALDVGVSQSGHGRFPQIGGFSFVFDRSLDDGERVLSITLDDGTELDPGDSETAISVAISSFMSTGGDDYTMFLGLPRIGEFDILQEILANFLNYADMTVYKDVEGRIVDMSPAVEE